MTSRYADSGTYEVTLPDGTVVTVLRVPAPTSAPVVGWHRRSSDERPASFIIDRLFGDASSRADPRACDRWVCAAPSRFQY